MITNIACYVIIALCAISQVFMGAYIHVAHEMVIEYREVLSMTINQLSQVNVQTGVIES